MMQTSLAAGEKESRDRRQGRLDEMKDWLALHNAAANGLTVLGAFVGLSGIGNIAQGVIAALD